MTDPAITGSQAARLAALAGKMTPIRRHLAAEADHTSAGDSVEISATAARMSELASAPNVRWELIEQVRQRIADGTYDTPQKVDAALDTLADDLL